MDLTDPALIAFVNGKLRPLAEKARDFTIIAQSVITEWAALSAAVPNSADAVIVDNRQAEDVTSLTGADVHAFMAVCAGLNYAGTRDTISKPCVRAPYEP